MSHIAPDVPYALYIWPYITGIKSTGGAFDPPTQQTINMYIVYTHEYMYICFVCVLMVSELDGQ